MSIRRGGAAALAACLLLSVAACGGGGGGGGGTAFPIFPVTVGDAPVTQPPTTAPEPEPSAPEAPQPQLEYQLVSAVGLNAEKYLKLLDDEGSKGFRWAGYASFEQGPRQLLRKDKTPVATYAYELGALSSDMTEEAFLAAINEKGARGFRVMSGGLLFQKDGPAATRYSYVLKKSLRVSQTTQMGEFDFRDQLNEQGALGARYVGERWFSPTPGVVEPRSIFEVVDGTHYAYEALPPPESDAEMLEQMNAQGAKGYRFSSVAASLGPTGMFRHWMYVKDSKQASKFAYQVLGRPNNAADYLLQLKTQAERDAGIFAANFLSLDGMQAPGPMPVLRNIYSTSTACTGILCGELLQFAGIDQLL